MIVAFDTETFLIRPGKSAPELVCVSICTGPGTEKLLHVKDPALKPLMFQVVESDTTTLVGHNVAYDLGVLCAQWPELLPAVFAKYERDRITDTMIREQLTLLAKGQFEGRRRSDGTWVKHTYRLADLSARRLGMSMAKGEDTWRERYSELIDIPIDQWPPEASKYAIDDAMATWGIYQVQEKDEPAEALVDQYRQSRAAWWTHLTSAWGLRTNPEGVAKLEEATKVKWEECRARLEAVGLCRADGSRDTKKAKERAAKACGLVGIAPRMTAPSGRFPNGQIQLDEDACGFYAEASGDEVLRDYGELSKLGAIMSKDIPMLAAGTVYPIHSRFGFAATGRLTSSKPNIQNIRRLPGIRECFVPRTGCVFAQSDYEQLELRTLAQVCIDWLGKSHLAEVLNAGLDPHTALAADILGISYEEATANKKRPDVEAARQTAKVANFGFPGGLGATSLVEFARKTYGVVLTEARARELKRQWQGRWPEMVDYFELISQVTEVGQPIVHVRSGRMRGDVTYTAGCNSPFQGLGADAMKRAGWLISKACYTERESPLYRSRIVNAVHDEFIVETPDVPEAHEVAMELARLMVAGANEFLPDVPAKTEPCLMSLWSKNAKTLWGPDGRLQVWRPE